MNLFFDTETTGLPPKNAKWSVDYMSFPHIVQLSWKCSDKDVVHDYIIKPDGYEIPVEATNIHGISTEKALKEGIFLKDVLDKFLKDCEDAIKVVGHNTYFDTSIIKANVLRITQEINTIERVIEAIHKSKRIDTMMKTIKFCSMKQRKGNRLKYPTLLELHNKLFNCSFDAHNAKEDVLATERCFNELVRIGVI